MNKTITLIKSAIIYEIDSQPGDATHYSYFIYRDGPDNFCIMPKISTFKFPQRINYWAVKKFYLQEMSVELGSLVKEYNCNAWTLKEVIDSIVKIHDGNFPT